MGEGATAPTIPDDATNDNDGTMVNMGATNFVDSIAGSWFSSKSLLLDGSNEYVTMGDVLDFDFDDAFSISFWFKSTDIEAYLVSKLETIPGNRGYGVALTTPGKLAFSLISTGGSLFSQLITDDTFTDGRWHHVVCTYTANTPGAAADMNIYVDGVDVPTTVGSSTLGSNTMVNSAPFNLGSRTNGAVPFAGNIDEAAVYDRALRQVEVMALYNEGVPPDLSTLGTATDLVGWWRAELTGTTGGSYGGNSTGPFDVWEAIADIVHQPNGSSPGWCILKSPDGQHGPFYALLAMEGPADPVDGGYTWYSDRQWALRPSLPTAFLPVRAEGAAAHGRSRYGFFQMAGGTQTTRGYFSGAPEDGSFIFAMNWTAYPNFTGLQMFHVLDSAHPDGVMPTCSYSHSSIAVASYVVNADYFYSYHPRYDTIYTGDPTTGSGVRCVATYPQYETTPILLTPMPTVNFEGNVDPFPLFLIAENDTGASEDGRSTFVGRVPDLYSAPTGLNEADTMPSSGPEYFQLGDWLLPGDTTPLLGP